MENKQFTDLLTNAAHDLIQQSAQYAHIYQNPVLMPIHTIRAGLDHPFVQSFLQILQILINELKEIKNVKKLIVDVQKNTITIHE